MPATFLHDPDNSWESLVLNVTNYGEASMAATAYNLKKFLKFIKKDVKSVSIGAEKHLLNHLALLQLILSPNRSLKI